MATPSQQSGKPANRGPLSLLLFLAALPFGAKGLLAWLAVTGYLWQSLYKLFQAMAPVFWRHRYGHKRPLECLWPVGQPLPSRKTWLLAVLIAIGLGGTAVVAVLTLAPRLGLDPLLLRGEIDAKFSMTPLRAIGVVFYLFTINAALEELHFRAWLDRELSARWGNVLGIGTSAVAFAAMHLFIFAGMQGVVLPVLVLLFVALSVAGVSWSLLARLPGGIHAAWLSHGLTDAGLLTWGLHWLGYF